MIADSSLQLQKAINQHLRTTPAVALLVSTYKGGPAIFDAAPADAALPYISTGASDMLPEVGDCIEGVTVTMQLDAWASNNIPGIAATVRSRQLGTAIAAALDGALLTLDAPQRLVDISVERTTYLRDPDGLTAHAAITVRAATEPTDAVIAPGTAGTPIGLLLALTKGG
jgi:hypothetical protein